jgi:hypothetical protein
MAICIAILESDLYRSPGAICIAVQERFVLPSKAICIAIPESD